MSELKHTDLNWREFGSQQLNVTHFFEWLDSKRLSIRTIPSIADYQFVQIEALLCTIERAATPLDEESALADIEANPRLAENERASKIVPRWHIAADAHQQWRKLITEAIADGELVALDAGSKLPVTIVAGIFSADEAQNIHSAPENSKFQKNVITTTQALTAFEEMTSPFDLRKLLSNKPKWIKVACIDPGKRGSRVGTWNPLLLAIALRDQKKIPKSKLTSAFSTHKFLFDWRDDWLENSDY